MALTILCGLDRTGKSTVAAYYESLGCQVIHQSAPKKGISRDEFIQEQIDIITSAASKDVVLDRSYYGEAFIWPQIYGRTPLIDSDDIDILREIEDSVGVRRILMYDNNLETHWKRCVDNKEPLTKIQFVKARALYSQMSSKYGFELVTLQNFIKQFPEAEKFNQPTSISEQIEPSILPLVESIAEDGTKIYQLTTEQKKLERANAINDILSKRILKAKNGIYDELENDIRLFLNTKLGKLFGSGTQELLLTPEETKFFKMMYKRAIEKQ
jgi:hypothetical protein